MLFLVFSQIAKKHIIWLIFCEVQDHHYRPICNKRHKFSCCRLQPKFQLNNWINLQLYKIITEKLLKWNIHSLSSSKNLNFKKLTLNSFVKYYQGLNFMFFFRFQHKYYTSWIVQQGLLRNCYIELKILTKSVIESMANV